MRLARYLLPIAAAATLSGCGLKQSWDETRALAGALHAALGAGEAGPIWATTTTRFRANGSKERFFAFVAALPKEMGALRDARQTNWNSQTTNGDTFVEMDYTLTFERGAAREHLVYRWVEGKRFALDRYNLSTPDKSFDADEHQPASRWEEVGPDPRAPVRTER